MGSERAADARSGAIAAAVAVAVGSAEDKEVEDGGGDASVDEDTADSTPILVAAAAAETAICSCVMKYDATRKQSRILHRPDTPPPIFLAAASRSRSRPESRPGSSEQPHAVSGSSHPDEEAASALADSKT